MFVVRANPVKEEVHGTQAHNVRHEINSMQCLGPQVSCLLVTCSPAFEILKCRQQKTACAHAGSEIRIIGSGRITSTIARMTGRGVKYCPAPPRTSSAFLA